MAKDHIPSELVMRYRRATGMPIMAAKRALEACGFKDRIPLIVASENRAPSDGFACDPQEDDDVVGPIIHAVLESVTERVIREYDEHIAEMRLTSPDVADFLSNRRGICHRIWDDAQETLRNVHGIEWRTPVELNPGTVFD